MKRMETFYVLIPQKKYLLYLDDITELEYEENNLDVFTLKHSGEKTHRASVSQIDPIRVYPTNWIYVFDEDKEEFEEIQFCEKYKRNDLQSIPLKMVKEDFERFVEFYFEINVETFFDDEKTSIREELHEIIEEHYELWDDGRYVLKTDMNHDEACENLILRLYRFNVVFLKRILEDRGSWLIFSYRTK